MTDLPRGTVTFLFTDMERYTQRWEQHPDAMRSALVKHDLILHSTIESHGGHVFKTAGDAFCAVFATAPDALRAILAAGHGAQTLLSRTTYDLVRDALPGGVAFHDLGEHRLKDLVRSEQIYQVVAQDLPSVFPPLVTLDLRPNNLPVQPTPLIGRERELEAATRRLRRRSSPSYWPDARG